MKSANTSVKSYERFQAWTACHQLVMEVFRTTRTWPKAEQYGLISQAKRAAVSAAANICEGSARRGAREFRRFLDLSLGSLSELSYLLRLAADLGYINKADHTNIEIHRDHANRLTWGLYGAVSRSTKKQPD